MKPENVLPKLDRVEDADENILGYVTFPNPERRPRLIRDIQGHTYEAQLDDYCTFACYRRVPVTTVSLLDGPQGKPMPAWNQVWRRLETLGAARAGKVVLRSDEIIREILAHPARFEYVADRPHGEATPDYSYVCGMSHCRCWS